MSTLGDAHTSTGSGMDLGNLQSSCPTSLPRVRWRPSVFCRRFGPFHIGLGPKRSLHTCRTWRVLSGLSPDHLALDHLPTYVHKRQKPTLHPRMDHTRRRIESRLAIILPNHHPEAPYPMTQV